MENKFLSSPKMNGEEGRRWGGSGTGGLAGNANFHHEQVFVKKLFRVSSQSLQIFKIFGGFKFRFEVLNLFNYNS